MTIRLDLSVLNVSIEEVKPLIRQIRPGWEMKDVKRTIFNEGLTNSLGAFYRDTIKDNDTVVIRINGATPFLDRQKELESFDRLAKADICEPLIASFNNGLVMKLIKGSTLTQSNVSNKTIALTTAIEIAKLHTNVKLNSHEAHERFTEETSGFIRLIPHEYTKQSTRDRVKELAVPSRLQLESELGNTNRYFAKQSTPLVACHNDLLLNNFLYDHGSDSIKIIDYEYLSPNPAAFDIANHFNEYAGTENVDYSNVPDETYQKWWLKEYLTAYYGADKVTSELINEWYESVQYMQPLSHLLWGCWSMMQAELSDIDFDYVEYAKLRLDQYFKLTNQLFNV